MGMRVIIEKSEKFSQKRWSGARLESEEKKHLIPCVTGG